MKIAEIFALNTKLHNFSFTKEKFRENIQYNLARVLNSTLISRFFATLNMMRAAQSVKKREIIWQKNISWNTYSVSTLEMTIFREIISLVRVNFRSTFLSLWLTQDFDTLMGGNTGRSSIAPNKSFQLCNQLGAEKSASEIFLKFRENCRL